MARSYDIAILAQKVERMEREIVSGDVIANPTGDTTADLTAVQIDGVKYNVSPNSDVTFTPVATVEKVKDTLTQVGNGVLGTLQLRLSNTINTWVEVGTFNKLPADNALFPIVSTVNGSPAGMGEINPTTGVLRLYTTQELSAASVAFNVTYKIAAAPTVTTTSTRSRKKKEE